MDTENTCKGDGKGWMRNRHFGRVRWRTSKPQVKPKMTHVVTSSECGTGDCPKMSPLCSYLLHRNPMATIQDAGTAETMELSTVVEIFFSSSHTTSG